MSTVIVAEKTFTKNLEELNGFFILPEENTTTTVPRLIGITEKEFKQICFANGASEYLQKFYFNSKANAEAALQSMYLKAEMNPSQRIDKGDENAISFTFETNYNSFQNFFKEKVEEEVLSQHFRLCLKGGEITDPITMRFFAKFFEVKGVKVDDWQDLKMHCKLIDKVDLEITFVGIL